MQGYQLRFMCDLRTLRSMRFNRRALWRAWWVGLVLGWCLSGVSAALAAEPSVEAHARNALFQQLLDPGVALGGGHRGKLPVPTMPDGLDAAAQKKVISEVIGNDYSWEEFTRRSVVAPQVLRIRDITPSLPDAPARGVDVWFVVHGDLSATDDDGFRNRLLRAGRESGGDSQGGEIRAEELASRGIVLSPEAARQESYGHFAFDFLDRVRLRAAGRAVWSRTPESLLIAAEIDPRFTNDQQFPNQWQPLTKEGGMVKVGPPSPWSGAAFYLKITRLHEPSGALFVELHILFVEPVGWFDGANLLRSKLPPAVQTIVRNMRREWAKTKP